MGILEEALFSLLPPVPTSPVPPLPPRPDVVMDPPASEEVPVPTPDPTGPLPPADPILPAPPLPPRPDMEMDPPASQEDPDPTPAPDLPTSPRPPKARTPPALPSPGRTSFALSEWNYPRRTYRFLEDIPLVLTPPPVFVPAPAASQQPPQPPDPTPASEPSPVQLTRALEPPATSSPLPRPDTPPALGLSPTVDDDTIVVATPPGPGPGTPPDDIFLDPDFMAFALGLGCTIKSLANPGYVKCLRKFYDAENTTPVITPDPRPDPHPLPYDQGEVKPQRKNRRYLRKC